MEKKTLNVAFSTQKGGAGKTTLTVLVASYLHYVKGYNVAVIDCDFPQHSIAEMRERDIKMSMDDDHYKLMAYEQFSALGKKAYEVIESSPENAMEDAQEVIEVLQPDFVFFDLPGTINNPAVVHTLSLMDYIIAPISADRLVLESTLQYVITVNDALITPGKAKIKGLYLLWNLVDGREKTELYEVYEDVIDKLGFPLFKTFLPDSKRFRREQSVNHKALFRSTLFPADKALVRGSNLDALIDEMLETLK
ncbi:MULTISPECIES: ParA family protein [Bacteroidales]|jgi:protein found in conjugate transposon|uniref:CobQ/CobB/MinD/ParA nucleotide binding domain-containing protein n=1 Tax=bioreactor metagenome TaxID=1076179 RepID=A0A644W0E3_9ZZZZ|nr:MULTISPECIES: ParA family protein [Bacteroidales]OJV82634.1 MAG: conjugal transfer protein TraA [Bacteroidia bacterium 44-10]MCL3850997.1 ParA family protein [Parabacteroides leei]MDC2614772.1 ParA family protein [Bacteroides ovatus]MDC2633869.1 ParA family protein [Bacteroides ovatus]MDH6305223.1 cellulose biosynthesis protein BcsQ [Parabacteroides sp. PH5-39]